MHINPGHSNSHAALVQANGRNQRETLETAAQPTEETAAGDIKAPQPEGDGGEPGVIGLLQAGHFRGAADVRLRIVHSERLAALQQSQTVSSITENAGELTAALSSIVGDLAAENPVPAEGEGAAPVADPLQVFQEGVDAAVAELINANATDIAGFSLSVQASFAALVEQLGLNEVPPADTTPEVAATEEGTGEESVAGVNGDGGEVVEAAAPRDYLAELTTAFQTALDDLLGSASESVLPPISEPSGNGKAFDKFMAIYESLQSIPADAAVETEVGVETEPAAATSDSPITEIDVDELGIDVNV